MWCRTELLRRSTRLLDKTRIFAVESEHSRGRYMTDYDGNGVSACWLRHNVTEDLCDATADDIVLYRKRTVAERCIGFTRLCTEEYVQPPQPTAGKHDGRREENP